MKRKEKGVRIMIAESLQRRLKSEAALAGVSLRSLSEEVITDGLIARQIRENRK